MNSASLATKPELRRLPVPIAEPRPAVRVLPEPDHAPPRGQGVLALTREEPEVIPPIPAGTSRVPPPAAAWVRQFVQAALEAATGRRPVSQLVRWTDQQVFAMLTRRASLTTRFDGRIQSSPGSCLVRSVRLCRPAPAVVEASALALDRGRYRAVALRMEDADGRWRVTALEIG